MNDLAFPPTTARPGVPPAPLMENLWVLLVEDNAVDRLALRRYLAAQNLPYRIAETGSIAEARQRLAYNRFDVLVLDQHLPDGTGFELFEIAGETPVVFVTGVDDTELAVKALKAGAADYLVKDPDRKYLGLLPLTLARVVQERRMKAALHSAQEQVRRLLEFLPAAAFAFDAEGLITFYNPQAPVLWGYKPILRDPEDRYCGRVRLFLPDETPLARESCWRALIQGQSVKGLEIIVETTRGQRRQVLAYANPLQDRSGRLTGAVVIWVDITERRKLEQQQHALEAQLQRSRRLEAIGTLAGGMAHEFNNQLTAILGNLQLAELDLPPDHAAHAPVTQALDASRRSRDLVARMLTFSENIREAAVAVQPESVVAEAARLLRASLPEGIELSVAQGECPPVKIDLDELSEAIMQLGLNAIQTMRKTGGRLHLALQHAVPTAEFRHRHPQVGPYHTVRLTVQDTGPGLSPGELEHLSEPFFATRGPKPTDPGLAGVHGTMKRYRGAVVIESAPGAGTSIHLFLPPADRLAEA